MVTTPPSGTKNCPDCRSLLAADAVSCVCGHRFLSEATAPNSSAELVTKAEELYESHLRARLQNALRALKFARVEVMRTPTDVMKQARLRQAERDMKDLETQLAVQNARVSAARAAAIPTDPTLFRETQAVRAKEVVDFARVQEAAEHGEATLGTAKFSTQQLEKAEQVLQTVSPPLCAGCGATLIGASRCECGFVAQAANDADSDFLTDEEKWALRKAT